MPTSKHVLLPVAGVLSLAVSTFLTTLQADHIDIDVGQPLHSGADGKKVKVSQVERGYSGDYLPYYEGGIINILEQNLPEEPHLSLSERFQRVTERLFGNSFNFEAFLNTYAYNPNANDWEGFCDQWSAAASDPHIKKHLASINDGLMCGDLSITKGQLQELFTIFYDPTTKQFFPKNGRIEQTPVNKRVKAIRTARQYLDYTYFEPALFASKLHEFLDKHGRATLNVDSGPEIWNQPVHFVKTETIPLQQYYWSDYGIPSSLLSGSKKLLEKIEALEQHIAHIAHLDETTIDDESEHAIKEHNRVLELITRRQKLLSHRGIRLSEGVSLQEHSTIVHYMIESKEFATVNPRERMREYHYITLHKKGELIGSIWGRTPLAKRPGFIAVPKFDLIQQISTVQGISPILTRPMPKKVDYDDSKPKAKWSKSQRNWYDYESKAKRLGLYFVDQLFHQCHETEFPVSYDEVDKKNR